MVARYVPDAGDLIWMNFDPQVGHEQAGHRPEIVLSPASYNGPAGLALVCPITTKSKGYPFEIPLPQGAAIGGVVLSDQVRSMDWRVRRARPAGRVSARVLESVRDSVTLLLERSEPL